MMRAISLLVVVGLLLGVSSGCATLVRGDKQTVKFVTDPAAAKLVVDGKNYVTPADVIMKRKAKHEVTIAKEGYQTITFKLSSHWDGGGVGAVALDAAVPGGSALFLIDLLSGADHKFNALAKITLPPSPTSNPEPLTLWEYKGKLMSKPDYDAAVEHDKLFKSKKKDTAAATTQPARGGKS